MYVFGRWEEAGVPSEIPRIQGENMQTLYIYIIFWLLTWNGIVPHLCEGMALNRCACNPSRELLPHQHLCLFSWTSFSTTTFTEKYSCMPGGFCKAQNIARSSFIMVSFEMLPYKSTASVDLNRWIPSMSRPAGPLNSAMMDSVTNCFQLCHQSR